MSRQIPISQDITVVGVLGLLAVGLTRLGRALWHR